jgi:L-fuculose-phosphate aldolase
MRFEKERSALADIGREFLGTGMTVATGGNISIRIPDEGVMIITPSGMDYRTLSGEDMCILDVAAGKQLEGTRTPSSETPMHLAVYRERDDFHAVAHTHPPYCTAFSMIREPIPLVHYLIPVLGKSIPVAEYATYGTEAMGPAALSALEESAAVILPNHGLLTAGADITQAVNRSGIAEYIAHSYAVARGLGSPVILPEAEDGNLREQFGKYGQRKNDM